jgi:hypothetical protein
MPSFTYGRFRQQAGFLRRQFLQDGDLPFTDVLSERLVARTLSTLAVFWRDRIHSPLVTLWVFLGQVLSADHSCRAAAARLMAHRLAQGEPVGHDNAQEPYGRLWRDAYSELARLYDLTVIGVSNVGWITGGPWQGASASAARSLLGRAARPSRRGRTARRPRRWCAGR